MPSRRFNNEHIISTTCILNCVYTLRVNVPSTLSIILKITFFKEVLIEQPLAIHSQANALTKLVHIKQ